MVSSAGFPAASVEWLACPVDGGTPLSLSVEETGTVVGRAMGPSTEVHRASDSGTVTHGTLTCPTCSQSFPIEDGIPRLLPEPAALDEREADAKTAERRQRDREAGIYDRNLFLRILTAAEAPATLSPLAAHGSDRVLEVGCGTGRFTARLAGRVGSLLAVDHSVESLKRAREKAGDTAAFIQADASYLPVRSGWATRLLSCQMLEHIPTPAARRRAVSEMARTLAPGGGLVLSAYYHPPVVGRWLPKEGRHSGEIYFYCFTRQELAALLGESLRLRGITGSLVYILLAHARKPSS